jgi:hypothetical protein
MTPLQRVPLDKIPALPNDALTSTAQWVASVQAAAAEIEKMNDPKLTEFVSTDLQKDEDWAIIGHIVPPLFPRRSTMHPETSRRSSHASHPCGPVGTRQGMAEQTDHARRDVSQVSMLECRVGRDAALAAFGFAETVRRSDRASHRDVRKATTSSLCQRCRP